MTSNTKLAGERLVTSISHSLRIEIQRILFYRVASPKEVARELGASLSFVSHHFKVLEAEGCIVLVGTEPRGGAVEHFYEAIFPAKHDNDSWAALAKSTREESTRLTLQGLFGEVVRALNEHTFDERDDRRLSWIPMNLDEQGCRDLFERQNRWLEEVEELKDRVTRHLGDGEGERAVGALLGFKTPPGFGPCDQGRRWN